MLCFGTNEKYGDSSDDYQAGFVPRCKGLPVFKFVPNDYQASNILWGIFHFPFVGLVPFVAKFCHT